MAIYESSEGMIEIWIAEYPKKVRRPFRVPDGQSPISRITELAREQKNPVLSHYIRLREATGDEISEYARKHPDLKIRDGRLTRKEEW